MFKPIFGPDKHTGEVRFHVKPVRKKLIFDVLYMLLK